MSKKISILFSILCILFFLRCSKQEGEDNQTEGETVILNSGDIEVSIDENAYLKAEEIAIDLPEGLDYSSIRIYLDSKLVLDLPKGELQFELTPENIPDGVVEMKIEIIDNESIIGSKTINVKIDNNGPSVDFGTLLEDSFVCGGGSIPLEVSDEVSKVASVIAYWGQEEIGQLSQRDSNSSFEMDFSELSLGERYLKLEMEDERNNRTVDSVLVKLAKKITQINFPEGFVRPGIDEIHVILSDSDGAFISSVTHSSGVAESLSICSTVEFDQSSEFILTFVSEFESALYGIYPYHNLTLALMGNEINLPQRSAPKSTSTVEIELPDSQQGDYVRASGQWSSALNYQGNILSGHFSRNYMVESLGSNNFFVMNFNPDIRDSYKWAFIEDPHTFFKLEDKDFSVDNVYRSQLNIVGTSLSPYLAVYGFENESHFNSLITHMLYWNPSLNRNNGYDYSYADIFYDVLYSIKVSNYSIEGLGTPPTTVSVPNRLIDYTFQDNMLQFSGLSDFEVGRAQFRNTEDAHILVEMYFDGMSTEVVVPEMPEFLGSKVTDIVNNGALEIRQCVVENYINISDYEAYITNIAMPSIPFYKVSPSRERIFKSSVSTSLLPMMEFPFYGRF